MEPISESPFGNASGGSLALTTMRLMTGKRADTLLELMSRIEYFTLVRARTTRPMTDAANVAGHSTSFQTGSEKPRA